jgi:preprotein translocase subunit YajC
VLNLVNRQRHGLSVNECLLLNAIVLAADPGLGGAVGQILFFIGPIFAIWYFLVIRPQQQQRRKVQEMLDGLKTGDRVLTSGGIYGTVVAFNNGIVQLEVAKQVKIEVARSAITSLATNAADAPAKQPVAAKPKK